MSHPNITAPHTAVLPGPASLQACLADPQGASAHHANQAATLGNPVVTTFQPVNPNVIPNPTIEQLQTINKALNILNNHQLLMKFATENKQVCDHVCSCSLLETDIHPSRSRLPACIGRRLPRLSSLRGQHGGLWWSERLWRLGVRGRIINKILGRRVILGMFSMTTTARPPRASCL
jgi:hypothetical protein